MAKKMNELALDGDGYAVMDEQQVWAKLGKFPPELKIAKGYRVRGIFREGQCLHGLVYLRAIDTWMAARWDLSGRCLVANTGPEWMLSIP